VLIKRVVHWILLQNGVVFNPSFLDSTAGHFKKTMAESAYDAVVFRCLAAKTFNFSHASFSPIAHKHSGLANRQES
jgi:hypothetical protein